MLYSMLCALFYKQFSMHIFSLAWIFRILWDGSQLNEVLYQQLHVQYIDMEMKKAHRAKKNADFQAIKNLRQNCDEE